MATDNRVLTNQKKEINIIREKLKIEFSKSINIYWKNKIKNIPTNDTTKMFPQLNSIFRKKEIAEAAALKIPSSSPILNNARLDISQFEKDDNNNIIINTKQDKLNVMGAYFASVNNKIYNNKPQFNKLINNKIKSFTDQITNERRDNNYMQLQRKQQSRQSHALL